MPTVQVSGLNFKQARLAKRCRVCSAPLEPFISFGKMPKANAFLVPEEFDEEFYFELAAALCGRCGIFQLVEQPNPRILFHEKYPFFTGSSKRMTAHFRQWATEVMKNYLETSDPFVIEIGSNDGSLLEPFAQRGIRHLGIDPSSNVVEKAQERGVRTICKFFDDVLASSIVNEFGQADAFFAANVLCHTPDLHSVMGGMRRLLKPTGIAMIEDPYLGDMIQSLSYDQIYDEHVFLFSISALAAVFERHGLEVFHVEPQWTHGGSMRYYVGHQGRRPISERAVELQLHERRQGLHLAETYHRFRGRCEESKNRLISLLREKKKEGKRVVGYAATSKSTTVINYCGITSELLNGIFDTTPLKQGKFSPGAHLPVLPYEDFSNPYPDYALLFAWNHAEEIMEKERHFRETGGKWILYVPEVRIL